MTLVLFDSELEVHYGFAALHSRQKDPDLTDARAGQSNGLCGAAVPGALSFVTGLHTGAVPFRIEWHEREPPLDDVWEDVVEVPFRPTKRKLTLSVFQEAHRVRLPHKGSQRARLCASGMDVAHSADVRMDDDPVLDRYLLQLWPAPPAPDTVIRRTSEIAEYWHGVARDAPPPPTAEERAEAKRFKRQRKQERRERERVRSERVWLTLAWGPVLPSERILALSPGAQGLARADRELAEALLDLDPVAAHALAVRVVREACAFAGPVPVHWAPALDALQRGETLPPPFDDREHVWHALYPSTETPPDTGMSSAVSVVIADSSPGARPPAVYPPAAAMAALLAAAREPTPVESAMVAIEQAAAAHQDQAAYYAALRSDLALGQA